MVGVCLGLGGGYFVISKLVEGWSEYGDQIKDARWGWVVAGVVLATLGMSSMGQVWRRIIAALGGSATRAQVFVWYQFGNLGKYVPGGVWAVVGRSELAVRGGLARPVAYNSVALSMGATYLCATIVCALLLPFLLIDKVDLGWQWWFFLLIPIGLGTLHPAVLGRILRIAEKVLGKGAPPSVPPWLTSAKLVLAHTIPWLLNGVATWLVALAFVPDISLPTVVFAGILSWVIGFFTFVGVGGLGVREAAFVAIATFAMPEAMAAPAGMAAVIAIVSRLVFMAADVLGATAAVPVRRRLARKSA